MKPAASVAPRRTSSAGQARSGFTWSAVTGETPPQSSMPEASRGAEVVGEVGRGLEMDLGGEHQPGGGDGPEELVGRARRRPVHRGARLGQEVLDDHLLDVAVAPVAGGDGLEGVQPVGPGLADAHQEAGGEGDAGASGGLQGGQPAGRGLVGGRAVGGQIRVERLDHHPLAGRDRAEAEQIVGSRAPALAWGSSPVSSTTARHAAAR